MTRLSFRLSMSSKNMKIDKRFLLEFNLVENGKLENKQSDNYWTSQLSRNYDNN